MDTLMRLPMKVSTTTSNFMIGVTAAASAGIYLSNKTLRLIFLPVMVAIAVQMVLRGLGIAL